MDVESGHEFEEEEDEYLNENEGHANGESHA